MQINQSIFLDASDAIVELKGQFGFSIVPEPAFRDGGTTHPPVNVYLGLVDEPMAALAHLDNLMEALIKVRAAAIQQASIGHPVRP